MSLRRLGAACSIALALTALLPAAPSVHAGTCYGYKDSERAFVRKINRARARAGRTKLRLDPHLARVAQKHSWEMRLRGQLFHQSAAQFRRRVTRWSRIAENVGVGAAVKSLHRAFMVSPGHRANILGPYRHVGVAVTKQGRRMWVTVIFEAERDPGTRLDMPRC
jgi:uncharacterized protein YkwD